MASEHEIEIAIRLTAERTGATLAKNDIDQIKQKTRQFHEEGSKGAQKQTENIKGLDRALNRLFDQFGALGRIADSAFKSFAATSVIGVAVAIQKVVELVKELKTEMDAAAARAFKAWETQKDSALKYAEALKQMKEATRPLSEAEAGELKILEALITARQNLVKALEQSELAAAGEDKEAQARIKARYEMIRAGDEESAQTLRLEKQKKFLAQAEAKLAEAAKQTEAARERQARAERAPLDEEDIRRRIKAAESSISVELLKGQVEGAVLGKPGAIPTFRQSRITELQKDVDDLKQQLTEAKALSELPKKTEAAIQEERAALEDVRRRRAALGVAQTEAGIASQSRFGVQSVQDFSDAAGIIGRGRSAEEARLGGQRLTAEQRSAIDALKRLAEEMGFNGKAYMEGIDRLIKVAGDSQAVIAAALRRIQQLEARADKLPPIGG